MSNNSNLLKGGGLKLLQNKYPILKILFDEFQNLFLDPEKTVNIFIKILDAIMSTVGYDSYALILQKPLEEFNILLVFLLDFTRQKYICSFIQILKLIPNLPEYLGIIDLQTMKNFQKIDFDNNTPKQIEIILKLIKQVENILKVVEIRLKIDTNIPFILKSPIIQQSLVQLFKLNNLISDEQKKDIHLDNSKNFDIYFNKKDNLLIVTININLNTLTTDNNNKFISNLLIHTTDYSNTQLNTHDFNNDSKLQINNFVYNEWEKIKPKLISEISNNSEINSDTTFIFTGHFINGCFAILLSLDIEFEEILCNKSIVSPKIIIITIGSPSFSNKNIQTKFIDKKNIKLFRFIKPTDIISFCYLDNLVHLGLPTILAKPTIVNDFYEKCCNKKFLVTDQLIKEIIDGNKLEDYYRIFSLLTNQFFDTKIKNYEKLETYQTNNKFLSDSFYLSNID